MDLVLHSGTSPPDNLVAVSKTVPRVIHRLHAHVASGRIEQDDDLRCLSNLATQVAELEETIF